jgi:hypothetical protein
MPDIQIKSADELATGVSLTPANFHNLVNNASVQSGLIGDQTAATTLEALDELLLRQASGGELRKIAWSNVAAEVSADFTRVETSEHPVIDVLAHGALGDNLGTAVAEWLVGGQHDRGYTDLVAMQVDYPWVESLFDTIDFAACQKALDVAWQKVKATYGQAENTTDGGLNAQTSGDSELTKGGTARSVAVYFPAGWYKTNKTLIVPPRVTVKGDGGKNTTIRYVGDRFTVAHYSAENVPAGGARRASESDPETVTVGGESETLTRGFDDKKWKYYNDAAVYKVPKRSAGMHALMMVRDSLPYTHATVTQGLYNGVATVTSTQSSPPTSASFLVNYGAGYANGATSIAYDAGSAAVSSGTNILHFEGGSSYTATNSLSTGSTGSPATGGTLSVPYSVYFQTGVDDNEKFYQEATLTVASSDTRIYPYTRIVFRDADGETTGVFVVTTDTGCVDDGDPNKINVNNTYLSITGYVESGTIADDDVGTIDIYSQGYNPAGAEQAADEDLSAAKNRMQDYDGEISGIQFSSLAWDDSIGLWLPGYQHDNIHYKGLVFKGYGSFNKDDDTHIPDSSAGNPRMSAKGMVGVMLNNGSSALSRCYAKNMNWTGCTFEACYVGLLFAAGKGSIVSGNQWWDNRFCIRMSGTNHLISHNRIDNHNSDPGGMTDYIPFGVGENAFYLRKPVGCVISSNSINQNIRAIELVGSTSTSITGNTILVPDPTGRAGTDNDYTAVHGFILKATAIPYTVVDATCVTTNTSVTVTCTASAEIKVGQSVSGTGIPTSTTVATVNTAGAVTSLTLSQAATVTADPTVTLTFTTSYTKYGYTGEGQMKTHNSGLIVTGNSWAHTNYVNSTYSPIWLDHTIDYGLSFEDATGDTHSNTTVDTITTSGKIAIGQYVTGSGIAAGTTVVAITGGSVGAVTAFTLSQAATTSLTGVTLTFAPVYIVYGAAAGNGFQPTAPLTAINTLKVTKTRNSDGTETSTATSSSTFVAS